MKVSQVAFENFRPYYGEVTIDLSCEKGKNIILVGGRNGQGKTSFLLGIVWCLYGQNIDKVDDIFKNEVKGNYTKFLDKALNWHAKSRGVSSFSVSVTFSHVELSDIFTRSSQKLAEISLKRTYNADNPVDGEVFEILMDGERISLVTDETEKINFVNDYLIPIDIAKFVFFDAEKISEIASLGAKDQATIMDKALGQVLGLNTYENLIEDLREYERAIQKNSASHELHIQISSFESAKEQNQFRKEAIDARLGEIDEDVSEIRKEISEVTTQLIKRGDFTINIDLSELKRRGEVLNEKLNDLKRKFHDVSDLIPLAILAPKLEEVSDHLKKEQDIQRNAVQKEVLQEKTKELAEKLFNKQPLPERDMDLETKIFYFNKAKNILSELYAGTDEEPLEFFHDFERSEASHILNVFELVRKYSKETFEAIFNDYLRVYNDYTEAQKELKQAEAFSQDDFIQDLQERKNTLEATRSKLENERGGLENELVAIEVNNKQLQAKIDNLLDKVQVTKKNERQIKIVQKYIKALGEFIANQKQEKKKILEKNLLNELKRILNKPDLIGRVEITILKNNLGLDVKLYDNAGRETNPNTDMSKGEQQLYISALLKSILSESIFDLPVFIDTPLGRLDQEHRDNILQNYYPELSDQVIILSTNTELRATDLPKIDKFVSRKYRLENHESKTAILEGYFV